MKIKLLVEMRILPFEIIETSEAWALELINGGHAVLVEDEPTDPINRTADKCFDASQRRDGRK